MRPSKAVALGAALAALGVAAGAFGAHGLESVATPDELETWKTAARYHQLHAVALVAINLAVVRLPEDVHRRLRGVTWAFVFGIAVFGGTLYGIGLGGPKWLGAITPLGGLGFIGGWAVLCVQAARGLGDKEKVGAGETEPPAPGSD